MYRFVEVDGSNAAEVIRALNALDPSFPNLTDDHLDTGFWWLLKDDVNTLCGFAGLVTCEPFVGVGYLKRNYVSPDHRGRGLQLKMIHVGEEKAKEFGWHQLVAETTSQFSARNFDRAGFERVDPEQPWGPPGSMYFSKVLTAA